MTLSDLPKYLTRQRAAEYVQSVWGVPCSPKTLAKLASIGDDGPEFHKAQGAALYTAAALDQWAEGRISGPMKRTAPPSIAAE